MDLKESVRDSTKVFCKGLCAQLSAKLFCLGTFMVYVQYHLPISCITFYIFVEYIKLFNHSPATLVMIGRPMHKIASKVFSHLWYKIYSSPSTIRPLIIRTLGYPNSFKSNTTIKIFISAL